MKPLKELVELAKKKEKKKVVVACCQDKEVLLAFEKARKLGLVEVILIGDVNKTKDIAESLNIKDMVMKGIVDTSIILKAVLNKEVGLRYGKILSQISILDIPNYQRLRLLTNPAMNIAPDLNTKKQIIENAVEVARSMEIEELKVACICAKEKVNPKMIDTVEAKKLE